ncbi:MAG: hypothetical protein O4751_12770 [Trichodesmium sp. St2_bin6]|nr:hypothetical protein [Trichodesmium sp. St2_bin6]
MLKDSALSAAVKILFTCSVKFSVATIFLELKKMVFNFFSVISGFMVN